MRYILLLCSPLLLFAAPVVPDAYAVYDRNATQYIVPRDEPFDVRRVAALEAGVMRRYAREFGYALDQKLYLAFASRNNQVSNAFSTQIPLNEMVLYGTGVLGYDRFASISWRKTLLIHESAHNFQLNPKTSTLARVAHAIGGNMPFVAPLFFPVLPVPNVTLNRFILEGNAVLNESRFGNGGRLYSGYALAQTVALARAGGITPEAMINRTLRFPYGEKYYLVGGFFQRFLAQRYGIERVNRYFGHYATQTIPLFDNRIFREHYGKDFRTLLGEFAQQMRIQHRGFVPTRGEVIARSQLDAPLSRHRGEILALVGDRRSAPSVLSYAVRNGAIHTQTGAWLTGKALRIDGRIYTRASAKVDPGATQTGLFDRNGYLRNGTAGKAVQGRLRDGRWVYLDAAQAWEEPQLYAGQQRFGTVNSSVLVRGDHLYYFRQQGRQRVLYRDHTPLVRIDGYDARPVDTDARGCVYFIAPSRHGSTAYRACGGAIERVVPGDDVIDLKLVDAQRAIVRTMGAEGYRIQRVTLRPGAARVPMMTAGIPLASIASIPVSAPGRRSAPRPYGAFRQLKYVGLLSRSTWSSKTGYGLNLEAQWSDPLWFNTLSFVLRYTRDRTLLRASYRNQAHAVTYGGSVTRVVKRAGGDNADYRDWGYSAYVKWPFLARGYWRGSVRLSLDQPYNDPQRRLWTASLDVARREQFGISKYPSNLNAFSAFVARDRGAMMWGGSYTGMRAIAGQNYLKVRGRYLRASRVEPHARKGIRVGAIDVGRPDRATMTVATVSGTGYVREALMAEAGFYHVFEWSWYAKRLPVSLLRESLYLKHRYYRFEWAGRRYQTMQESVLGLEADALIQHRYTLPIALEVLYNADAKETLQAKITARYSF